MVDRKRIKVYFFNHIKEIFILFGFYRFSIFSSHFLSHVVVFENEEKKLQSLLRKFFLSENGHEEIPQVLKNLYIRQKIVIREGRDKMQIFMRPFCQISLKLCAK